MLAEIEDHGDWDDSICLSGSVRFPPASHFSFLSPGEGTQWIANYEGYACAAGLVRVSDTIQVRTLLCCLGPQARAVFSSWDVPAPETNAFDVVKRNFMDFFIHAADETYEIRRFYRRTQRQGKSVHPFFSDLRNLVEPSNYQSAEEDHLVRAIFVVACSMKKFPISSVV